MSSAATTSIPATALAAVRAYFGLPQATLAAYFGLHRVQIAYALSGRRALPPAAWPRLARLLALLPPPWGSAPADEVPPPPALPPAAPLPPLPVSQLPAEATRAALLRHYTTTTKAADRLRAVLHTRARATMIAARQRRAADQLALPDPTDATPAYTARLAKALHLLAASAPAESPGAALDELRLWLLDTEAATLASWLGRTAPPS